jgi:hypothetical protein
MKTSIFINSQDFFPFRQGSIWRGLEQVAHGAFILTKGGPKSQKVNYLSDLSTKTKKEKIPFG